MTVANDAYWIAKEAHERARQAREFQQSDGIAPLTMGWAKYHPGQVPVSILDAWGNRREVTPKQHKVLMAMRGLDTDRITVRMVADSLGFAASTVTRALVKLAALGLVTYEVVRGRYGGLRLFHATMDVVKERSKAAWQKIRDARSKATIRWFSKLDRTGYPLSALNVATSTYQDATLTVESVDGIALAY